MFQHRVRIAATGVVLVLLDLFVALMIWKEAAGSATQVVVGLLAVAAGLGLAALFPPAAIAESGAHRSVAARSIYAVSAAAAVVLLALGQTWQVAGLGIVLGVLAGSTPALLRRRSRQLHRFWRP